MKSTEGVDWRLHKRWQEKYFRALAGKARKSISLRRQKYWAKRLHSIGERHPYAARPLRYKVFFIRVPREVSP